jgi:hypothetical protein
MLLLSGDMGHIPSSLTPSVITTFFIFGKNVSTQVDASFLSGTSTPTCFIFFVQMAL